MRAGDLWWSGRENALNTKLDSMAPSCFDLSEVLKNSMVKDGGSREGFAFRVNHIRKTEDTIAFYNFWKVCMEASIASIESAERAQSAIAKLRTTVEDFRGSIKNDMASMKAASERVQNEVQQMRERYKQAQDILTTPDFMRAIENAERMAKALEAIQKLTETKISVAVFGGGKNAN